MRRVKPGVRVVPHLDSWTDGFRDAMVAAGPRESGDVPNGLLAVAAAEMPLAVWCRRAAEWFLAAAVGEWVEMGVVVRRAVDVRVSRSRAGSMAFQPLALVHFAARCTSVTPGGRCGNERVRQKANMMMLNSREISRFPPRHTATGQSPPGSRPCTARRDAVSSLFTRPRPVRGRPHDSQRTNVTCCQGPEHQGAARGGSDGIAGAWPRSSDRGEAAKPSTLRRCWAASNH